MTGSGINNFIVGTELHFDIIMGFKANVNVILVLG
jgi:hypothetical protein